jgi:hypothetical protein
VEWFEGGKADFAEVFLTLSVFARFSTITLSAGLLFKVTFLFLTNLSSLRYDGSQ